MTGASVHVPHLLCPNQLISFHQWATFTSRQKVLETSAGGPSQLWVEQKNFISVDSIACYGGFGQG